MSPSAAIEHSSVRKEIGWHFLGEAILAGVSKSAGRVRTACGVI